MKFKGFYDLKSSKNATNDIIIACIKNVQKINLYSTLYSPLTVNFATVFETPNHGKRKFFKLIHREKNISRINRFISHLLPGHTRKHQRYHFI
ncbi:MAG: hypothetical protein JWN78_1937 [Bacteroidota bacterium]|nr:hypothetical protein [Bacteroidota bacterium]